MRVRRRAAPDVSGERGQSSAYASPLRADAKVCGDRHARAGPLAHHRPGENSIVHSLLKRFPERNDALAGILGIVTDEKFTLLAASVVVPAVLIGAAQRETKTSLSVIAK